MAVSHSLMSTVNYQQELGVRRLAAVYLDGISTTVYPHVVARNLAHTFEALHRTMWFHQSMRERRAMVRLPDGSLFADVSSSEGPVRPEDPIHDRTLSQRLELGHGFVFDEDSGTGWASRANRTQRCTRGRPVRRSGTQAINPRTAGSATKASHRQPAGWGCGGGRWLSHCASRGEAASSFDGASSPCAIGRIRASAYLPTAARIDRTWPFASRVQRPRCKRLASVR